MNLRFAALAVAFALPVAVAVVACADAPPPPPTSAAPARPCPDCGKGGASAADASTPPTAEEARAFLEGVDAELRRLWTTRDRASWVNQNFITDDTELLAAQAEEATSAYVSRAILASRRFKDVALPPDLARQMLLLRTSQTVPAPSDAAERRELAEIQAWMTSTYGKGKYCPKRLNGNCLTLDELSKTLAKSRNYDELLEAWTGWHAIAPPMKDKFARYAELGNKGAREIGYADMGELWRAGYDMSGADFEADIERLWQETKPFYDELHCYARAKLRGKYGKDKIGDRAPIPAHLLGNMWAQDWSNVMDLVQPYTGQPSLDVGKKLVEKKYDARKMVRLGEAFFVSLGMDKLPDTFWDRSLFTRPKDRDVVCHASAWDPQYANDLRIKMCVQPTEEDLITIHHELGHDYYYHAYYKAPMLFQGGANDGFHEGIGDTLALSVTPAYLKSLGLIDQVPTSEKALLNEQMRRALGKVAFLPFGLVIDKWRWDVLAGKIPKERYNQAWWALRTKYQGVSPPVARTEADFDAGAKYHVPASTPYIRYFLAAIFQFQFHRALCKAAGYTGPLDRCSIYGNKEAGKRLMAMLALGASKPWPEALATLSPGETKADASALLEYFAPLRAWLKEQNKGESCGW